MNTPHILHGSSPVIISFPHVATAIPTDQHHRYTERALASEDTDWFLDRLYAFSHALGATCVVPRWSRYLIDLNRPPVDAPMYPGRNNTELCPTRHFSGDVIYRDGMAPDAFEVERRIDTYWRPYHDTLQELIASRRAEHGYVVLFDAHSIMSELPWLFEGVLPNFSLGTADGASCAPDLRVALTEVFEIQDRFSHVVDDRFKGGYITRHYGRPSEGVHTVQLEMACRTYMSEHAPFVWSDALSSHAAPVLDRFVRTLLAWKPD
ncbi:MAG: N-formylglutamate deformylase [Gemmatimonadaceae bacterium]|nr:N-formylglutamate deformylase [Gemmatimonadaceae bacterium]